MFDEPIKVLKEHDPEIFFDLINEVGEVLILLLKSIKMSQRYSEFNDLNILDIIFDNYLYQLGDTIS